MCIICSDPKLGEDYLDGIRAARHNLKKAEKALLDLSKIYPKSSYGKAHKRLVKIRRSINDVESVREANAP